MAKFRNHIVAEGDTIQSIAHTQLGDYSRWEEIVEFNNLKYPYIVATPEEKAKNPEHLVTIGDTLLIRVSEDDQANLISNLRRANEYDQEEIYALALGKDLDILPKERKLGDPYFTEHLELKGNERGDLKTVKGIDNLKQALYVRLVTPKGSYIGHPTFGSEVHKYLGKKATDETAYLLTLEIERTLRTDRRVTSVIQNGYKIEGGTYTGYFTVYTMDSEEAFDFIVQAQENGPIVLVNNFINY